jgi:hypothetical protein
MSRILRSLRNNAKPKQNGRSVRGYNNNKQTKEGRLRTNSVGASQVLAVENRTSRRFSRIHVECGFYAGKILVGSGGTSFHDVQPGSIAHDSAVAIGASDADNVKCRIESQE